MEGGKVEVSCMVCKLNYLLNSIAMLYVYIKVLICVISFAVNKY